MCGRYVSPDEAAIERFWHIGRHNSNPFGPRYNVSPTALIPVLRRDDTGGLDLVMARWGLIPFWWKDAKPPRNTFNIELAGERAVTEFVHHPDNPRVNHACNEGAELIDPVHSA